MPSQSQGTRRGPKARRTPLKEWEPSQAKPRSEEMHSTERSGGPRAAEIKQGFEESLPMLVFAAVCLFLAVDFWGTPTRIGDRYYPIWILFLLIGAIAATGGTVAAFVPEDEEEEGQVPRSTADHVVIARAKWQTIQRELKDLKLLVNEILPSDLVHAAIVPTEAEKKKPVTESDIESELAALSARTRALDIGVESEPERLSLPVSAALELEGEPPVLTLAGSALATPGAGAAIPLASEVDALRTAHITGVVREPGETPGEFIRRATLDYARAGTQPRPVEMTRAVCASVRESYRRSSEDEMKEFSREIQEDLRQFMNETGVHLNPGETLAEYVTRVLSVLEAVDQTEAAPPVPLAQATSVHWSLSLFRGFLESYLAQRDVEALVGEVEREVAASQGQPGAPHGSDDLRTYAQLLKNSLKPLVGTSLGLWEMEALSKEIDAFVMGMTRQSTSPGTPPPTRKEVQAARQRLDGLFAALPGMGGPQHGATLSQQVRLAEAARPAFVSAPPPPAARMRAVVPPVPKGPVEREIESFRVAVTSGVDRSVSEEVEAYLSRALVEGNLADTPERAWKQARAVAATLAESYRRLTESQMQTLFDSVGRDAENIFHSARFLRETGETMGEFVLRVHESRAPPREAPPAAAPAASVPPLAVPAGGLSGLKWSLALFRGVLESYLSREQAQKVVTAVETDVEHHGTGTALAEKGQSDMMLYARLVKNALRSLPPGQMKPADAEALSKDIDAFVEEMTPSASPGASAAPKGKESAKQVKEKVDGLIQSLLSGP